MRDQGRRCRYRGWCLPRWHLAEGTTTEDFGFDLADSLFKDATTLRLQYFFFQMADAIRHVMLGISGTKSDLLETKNALLDIAGNRCLWAHILGKALPVVVAARRLHRR